MLKDTDIDAAVAQGIVTAAQAAALRDLARQRTIADSHEERFRFVKGFNDVFFTIGAMLFLLGVSYFLLPLGVSGVLFAAAIVWALAEILVRLMRLVLPGILLVIIFVTLVFAASVWLPAESWVGADIKQKIPSAFSLLQTLQYYPGGPLIFTARALVPAAAAGAFYWRFKLPFALVPMAVSLVVAGLGVASFLFPNAPRVADTVFSLVSGLGLFAAAMSFDMADRERVTRWADCAFWLHLLAAPLIVHSVMTLVVPRLADGQSFQLTHMNAGQALVVTATVLALTVVAVLIDRRALLVAGLASLGWAIGYALTNVGRGGGFTLAATLAILGAVVLTLGVGWVPVRRLLLTLLPPAISNRLPLVPARP